MNKKGFFGNWGGAYIPEVLHQTFVELKEEYYKGQERSVFWQEYVDLMSQLLLPADTADLCRKPVPPFRRGADLHQARGSQPHRRPQGQ